MEEEEGGLGGLLRLYWGLEGWEEDGIEVPWLMVLLKNYLYLLVFVAMISDLLTLLLLLLLLLLTLLLTLLLLLLLPQRPFLLCCCLFSPRKQDRPFAVVGLRGERGRAASVPKPLTYLLPSEPALLD